MQAWAVTISAALQRGVAWADLREKFVGSKFDPASREYTSLVDAVARNIDDMCGELRKQAQERGTR